MVSSCLSRLLFIFMVVGLVQVLAQPIKDNKAALDNFIGKRSPCINCKNEIETTKVNNNKYKCNSKRSPCVNCKNRHETTNVDCKCKDEKKDEKKSDSKIVRPKEEESSKSDSHSKGKKDSPAETERVEVLYPKEDSSEHDKHSKKNKEKHHSTEVKHYRVKPSNKKDGYSDERSNVKRMTVYGDIPYSVPIRKLREQNRIKIEQLRDADRGNRYNANPSPAKPTLLSPRRVHSKWSDEETKKKNLKGADGWVTASPGVTHSAEGP